MRRRRCGPSWQGGRDPVDKRDARIGTGVGMGAAEGLNARPDQHMMARFFKRKERPDGAQRQSGSRRSWLRRHFGIDRTIGLCLVAAFIGIYHWDPYPVQFMRDKTFDLYQKAKPREIPPPEQKTVTIVDIDEDSLHELGQWPWSRNVIADLIQKLTRMGAVLVAFDIVFPEADRTNPSSIAVSMAGLDNETREKLKVLPTNDEIMARSVKAGRIVLGQAGNWQQVDRVQRPPIKKSVVFKGPPPDRFLPQFPTLVRNVEVIENAAIGHGIFSLMSESDGIVRRVPAIFVHDGNYYPALSIEMLRVATGRTSLLLETDIAGVKSIGITAQLKLPTDRAGRIWPYFSRHDQAKYVSAKDVIAGTAPLDKIKNKLVIIGTSAVGLLDIRAIPTEDVIPGVEVHAQLIESVVSQSYLTRPNYADSVEMAIILFVGLLMVWLVPVVGARWTMILFLTVAGGAAYGSWYFFTEQRYLFDAGFAIVAILVIYTVLTYTGYAKEERERRQVRNAFSHYLSPAMVEKLAEDPQQLKLGGDKRNMTMLFCDVRGFTSISEQYDAVGLTVLINRLLTPLTDVILKRQGTVDKYMGDCIMAFWNAPMDDPDHARNACRAALEMYASMKPLNDTLRAEAVAEGRKFLPLEVGIGLNSGDVVVGNMGSDQRFDYSVLGDSVNLASRLESQSKTYGANIVLGEATRVKAHDMAAIELDLIKVKGKTEAVRIFALLGDEQVATSNAFIALNSANQEMLDAYRTQNWAGARQAIEACRGLMNGHNLNGFYALYEERIAVFEVTPPPDGWEGVYVAESK